jgi:amino-acid N-acetyltransferase
MSGSLQFQIRSGRADDQAKAWALLADAGLPTADLPVAQNLRFWIAEAQGVPQGVIALERFGSEGLLRSLAVAPEFRRHGFGRDLVARLERDARAEGVAKLVLLTESAEPFFNRLGYKVVDRGAAGERVRQSAEFQSLCPISAVCMGKVLARSSDAGKDP